MPFRAKSVTSPAKSRPRHLVYLFHVKHSPLLREKPADAARKAYSRAEMAKNCRPIRKRRGFFEHHATEEAAESAANAVSCKKRCFSRKKLCVPSCSLVSRETFASLETKSR